MPSDRRKAYLPGEPRPLAGRILSLRFKEGLAAAVSLGRQVRGHHWKAEWGDDIVDPTSGGSRQPAIYQAGTPVQALVEVELLGAGDSGALGTLTGLLGDLRLAGPIPLSDGIHVVRMIQTNPLDTAITRYLGDATWAVTGELLPAQADLQNKTLLEIFVVLGPPPPFFADGIWVEALRFLAQQVDLLGISKPHRAVRRITRYCHKWHGLRYISGGGPTTLGVTYGGGIFALSTFLQGSPKEVQCFDISAAVLVLAGAVGISVEWLQIQSFGFLNKTSLVGIGPCNSPFFIKDKTRPVVRRLSPTRNCFGIHAFCELPRRIFDACVGPHLGTSDRQTYLNCAVDTKNSAGQGVPPVGNIISFTNLLKGVG